MTVELLPYKGRHAIYVDGVILAIGRLSRLIPIIKNMSTVIVKKV